MFVQEQEDKFLHRRNNFALTLPFALVLTFVFSALISVSFLFVSVNLRQMYNSYQSAQAIAAAEGINERIKARLNTKTKIQLSPGQEEKLKLGEEEFEEDEEDEEEDDDDEITADDEFDEEAEDFEEYYADEILKISRYITFREPVEESETALSENTDPFSVSPLPDPLTHVEMIGSIDIPRGLTLNKGTMIVVFKDEKINLNLEEIVTQEGGQLKKPRLPIPIIKSLLPNYCETGARGSTLLTGENLTYTENTRFNKKEIIVEDIKAGPSIKFLVGSDVQPGLVYLYWDNAKVEFYIIPKYDGSRKPVINDITRDNEEQLISAKAGQKKIILKIAGTNLYNKKSPPVVLGDVAGLTPKLLSQADNGNEITFSLDIGKNVEPGIHSITTATEGGLSNSWVFNVLPPEGDDEITAGIAIVSSSLTLLNVRVIENLLPIIGEEGNITSDIKKGQKASALDSNDSSDAFDVSEREKLNPFANVDLETAWLAETTAMIGKITKTASEVITRQIPNIHAALVTNGEIRFDGGSFRITGLTNASTKLTEPVYLSTTLLMVEGPSEEDLLKITLNTSSGGQDQQEQIPRSAIDAGFTQNSFVAVYMEGYRITDLDYGVVSQVGPNTIELMPPGLMDFHYENDLVAQFIPPVITGTVVNENEAEIHLAPKELALAIPGQANSQSIFMSDINQFAELADLFTNDETIPKDEYDLPIGYMGLSYLDGTVKFAEGNVLSGKGILIIDTRSDNLGRPIGEVEFSGDSRTPIDFRGIIYVHGNLKISGNVNVTGALVIDNDSRGYVSFASNALGRITYDVTAIKQSLLYTPFTSKAGSVMISNKPIDLTGYVQSGKELIKEKKETISGEPVSSEVLPGTVTKQDEIQEPVIEKRPESEIQEEEIKKGSPEFNLIDLF